MTKILAFALLGLVAFPVAASAQPVPSRDDCAKQRGNHHHLCKLEIEAEHLTGDRPGPSDTDILGRRQPKFTQLIRYRTHFFDRIVASTDDR